MDLKWQVAMLSMRVKRIYKKTRRKLEFNGKELVSFDKTKVECFNCHRRGHFARDCKTARNPRNRGRDTRNAGYKGRDNEEEATDFALMAFTSNPSSSSSSNFEKGKQHKATYKAKLVSSISQPLQMLHMDLFGLTFVMSINHKKYCLIVTGDFSRFSWVFFLATKDETSKVLESFITAIENQINEKVKVIRCDNKTEFKNRDLDELCGMKGIKREYSNARTPQQNRVVERKNITLIKGFSDKAS
nr:putative ribonuclease H-like domain-containing protein [Tanacetum cinerariifolium]